MTPQRSEPRLSSAGMVKFRVCGKQKSSTAAVANLEDISPSGACLRMDQAILEDTSIEILCSHCRLRGKVRYCQPVETGFRVGIEFETLKPWYFRRLDPRHFLDIAILEISIMGRSR
jgi:hypothetical protein